MFKPPMLMSLAYFHYVRLYFYKSTLVFATLSFSWTPRFALFL